jgi:hypothetical protein
VTPQKSKPTLTFASHQRLPLPPCKLLRMEVGQFDD